MKLMMTLVLGLAVSVGALGCQERVVATHDGFAGSQYRPDPATQRQEPTFGERVGQGMRSTGDFLFGWTGLTGGGGSRGSNPHRLGELDDVDLGDRAGRSRQSTGSGW